MDSLFDRLQSEIKARQRMEGITPADVLDLSPELRRVVNAITRRGEMGLAEIELELNLEPAALRMLLDTLVEKGFLRSFEVEGEPRYKTFFSQRPGREVPVSIWDALSEKIK